MRVAMWTSVVTTHEFVAVVDVAIRQAPTNASVNQASLSPPVATARILMNVLTKAFARLILNYASDGVKLVFPKSYVLKVLD